MESSEGNNAEGAWVTDVDDMASENYSTVLLTLPDGNEMLENKLADVYKSGYERQSG